MTLITYWSAKAKSRHTKLPTGASHPRTTVKACKSVEGWTRRAPSSKLLCTRLRSMASWAKYQWVPVCAFTGKNRNQAPRAAARRVNRTQISLFRRSVTMLASRSKRRPCSRKRKNRSLPRVLYTSPRSPRSSKNPQRIWASSLKASDRSRMSKAQLTRFSVQKWPWSLYGSKMIIRASEAKTNHWWKVLGLFARKTLLQTLTTHCVSAMDK